MLWLALGSVLVWSLFLPFTQREQLLRARVERLFHEKNYEAALDELSNHQPDEYPPHWRPPPRRIDYREWIYMPEIWEALVRMDRPQWVCRIYERKLGEFVSYFAELHRDSPARILKSLEHYPRRNEALRAIISQYPENSNDPTYRLFVEAIR